MENNVFNELSDAIIRSLTHFINNFSGLLQIFVYLMIGICSSTPWSSVGSAVRSLVSLRCQSAGQATSGIREQLDDERSPGCRGRLVLLSDQAALPGGEAR